MDQYYRLLEDINVYAFSKFISVFFKVGFVDVYSKY